MFNLMRPDKERLDRPGLQSGSNIVGHDLQHGARNEFSFNTCLLLGDLEDIEADRTKNKRQDHH